MKLLLVLCLVAGALAVFGDVVSHDSTNEYNFFDDTPTEMQVKCIKDGIKKLEEENPGLDGWFKKLEESYTRIIKKVDECRIIDKEDERKLCMETVKTMVGRELDNLRKLLPTDKKDVFKKLETVIGECMETY